MKRIGFSGLVLLAMVSGAAELPSPRERNEQAVQEVNAGTRTEASAAWWGFNAEDATTSLQAALDSKAAQLTIPYMGKPWIVKPLRLHGNQEIVLEPGVMLLAKKGEFQGGGDSLLSANGCENLTIRGRGAILRMRKRDYQNEPYTRAEWRMGLALRGCKKVLVEGVRIESSGGDGIYLDGGGDLKWCEDVTIRGVVCDDNHRQGMSVISAQNLLVEDSVFSNTRGTAPEAGIDFEADSAEQRFVNCVVRNCVFENNHGNQMLVYCKPLSAQTEPLSILFENCVARMGKAGESAEVVASKELGGWGGMTVGAIRDDGPNGLVEFRNCVAENCGREGARVYDKSATSALVRFVNCSWKGGWTDDPVVEKSQRAPISIVLRRPALTKNMGGIEFLDCHVYDAEDRAAVLVHEDESQLGVADISGKITVHNPHGARAELGTGARNVTLEVTAGE